MNSNLLSLIDAVETRGDDGYRMKRIHELATFPFRNLAELRWKEEQRLLLASLKDQINRALPKRRYNEKWITERKHWERCVRNACIRYNEPEEQVWIDILDCCDSNPKRWTAHVQMLRLLYNLVRSYPCTRNEACEILGWSRQRIAAVYKTGHAFWLIRERAGRLECWQRLDWTFEQSIEAHHDFWTNRGDF